MRPFGIPAVDEESLVVSENIGDHQADEGEKKIFRARPGKARAHIGGWQSNPPLLKPGKPGNGHVLPVCCVEHSFPGGVRQELGEKKRED